jgi:hypothetical protein
MSRGDAPVPDDEPNLPQIGHQPGEGPSILTSYIEDLDLGDEKRVNAEIEFRKRKRKNRKVRLGFE